MSRITDSQKQQIATLRAAGAVVRFVNVGRLRQDFTPSERVEIGLALERELGERRGRPSAEIPQIFAELNGKETRELAAEKSGFGNPETYRQAKKVVEDATPEVVEAGEKITPKIIAKKCPPWWTKQYLHNETLLLKSDSYMKVFICLQKHTTALLK